jgi:hypothetical protein
VHEQDRADAFCRVAGALFKQEQLHAAVFARPMILALDGGRRLAHLVHHVTLC